MNRLNVSKPIPIKYSKSNYSFNDPNHNDSNYVFNLTISFKNKEDLNFLKIEKQKYSDMIDIEDDINYQDITHYKVEITKLPFEETKYFYIDEDFNNNINSYSKRSDDIYIEFTQNGNNKTICRCYFIGVDFNSIFISPPN